MGSGSRGREPLEGQVSSDISDVDQTSKHDLVTRGVAIDLLEATGRIGMQHEAAKHEELAREKGLPGNSIIANDKASHRSFCRQHNGALNERINVGVKTGRSRVGGPSCESEDQW